MWYLAWVLGTSAAIYFTVRNALCLEAADEKKNGGK